MLLTSPEAVPPDALHNTGVREFHCEQKSSLWSFDPMNLFAAISLPSLPFAPPVPVTYGLKSRTEAHSVTAPFQLFIHCKVLKRSC